MINLDIIEAQQGRPVERAHNGACPYCHKQPVILNVRKHHYAVCETHRVYWCVGRNLYSGWAHESPEQWHANAERLVEYRKVEPDHWQFASTREGEVRP